MKKIVLLILASALTASCALREGDAIKNEPNLETANINIRPSEDPTVLPEVSIAKTAPTAGRDVQCLTEAMYFEAKGTGERGMRAVGEVVLNRKNDKRFPNSVCGVVDQRWKGSCQFSYRCDGRPEVFREENQRQLAENIAKTLVSARGADITNGALFFHSKRIKPGWFGTLSRRGQFGGNIFYR